MKLLREPLLHFAVAGALLFGVYSWKNRNAAGSRGAEHTVRITAREIQWIVETSTSYEARPCDSVSPTWAYSGSVKLPIGFTASPSVIVGPPTALVAATKPS